MRQDHIPDPAVTAGRFISWRSRHRRTKICTAGLADRAGTDGDLCPAARSVITPPPTLRPSPRVRIYYKTNNRKLRWLRCQNSNNPHPCVPLLPSRRWLDFTTSSSLVSPRSDVARSGLTPAGAAAGALFSITLWLRHCCVFCSVYFFPPNLEAKNKKEDWNWVPCKERT